MVYLARHGQTDDNVPPLRVQGRRDTPLNDLGLRQAEALADKLDGARLQRLYTSNLSRAIQTAMVVGERAGVRPWVDERLAEGWRGEWEGRLFAEVEREYPEAYAAWRRPDADFRFPGGESLQEHRQRSLSAVSDVIRSSTHSLVVAHAGTIRFVLLEARGLEISDFYSLEIPNAEPIPVLEHERQRLRAYRDTD